MTQDEIIKQILDSSPYVHLSGAHALLEQNKKIRRPDPKDIDIYIEPGYDFKPLPGMQLTGTRQGPFDGSDNDDSEWEKVCYRYEGCNVDFFRSIRNPQQRLDLIVSDKGTRCVHYLDIIKIKLSYLEDDVYSKWKHRDDLLYFLIMN